MTIDGRSKRHPGRGPRQHPHGGELIAVMFGLDAGHAALNVAGADGLRGREGASRIGGVLGPVVFDHAAVAVDEHRLRETLIGMGVKNAAENLGFGRLRIGAQRRVEPLGEQRRAHVDLARAGAERQIALDPQMLDGERDDAKIAKATPMTTADGIRRRRTGAPDATRMCARAPSSAGEPMPGEAKRRFPAQCLSWSHWISVPVCRAYTRHRPFPDFATNYTRTAALTPKSLR